MNNQRQTNQSVWEVNVVEMMLRHIHISGELSSNCRKPIISYFIESNQSEKWNKSPSKLMTKL